MQKISLLFVLSLLLFSCEEKLDPTKPYSRGILVLNAGNFFDNNGSISHIASTDRAVTADIFQQNNGRTIAGNVVGYAEVNDKGVILVDHSSVGKDGIEIVDANTFKSVANLNAKQVENPRAVVKVSATKAYVTCWDATGDFSNFYVNPGYVAVLDLTTNQITKKIKVQNGAEEITVVGSEAFVGNTGSGKTKLTVINTITDEVKQEIEVGANPEFLETDANGKLWVYAAGELVRVNVQSKAVEAKVKITPKNADKTASSLVMSGDKKSIIYTSSFYDAADGWKQKGEVYSFSTSSTSITENTPFINKLFGGGLAVNPENGEIYAGLIPSYKQAGYVFRYKSNGQLIDSVATGIAPSKFFFK
jgi:hypothetical protein